MGEDVGGCLVSKERFFENVERAVYWSLAVGRRGNNLVHISNILTLWVA